MVVGLTFPGTVTPFLADENFPAVSITQLRANGLDVVSVREETPGIDDASVLRRAADNGQILLTLDKGFGRLVYLERQPAPPGVVYFRYDAAPRREGPAVDLLRLLADAAAPIEGFFVTVDRHLVRRRPLPSGTQRP